MRAWDVHAAKPDDMKVMVNQTEAGIWIEGRNAGEGEMTMIPHFT